jgi:hypothetical protein
MATAQDGLSIEVSYPALIDLSTFQYYPVALSTTATYPNGAITTVGATATQPIGVLQDAPDAAGVMGAVIISGPSKCVTYGGTVNANDSLGVGTDSIATVTTTDNRWLIGTAMESLTDAGTAAVIEVDVNVHRY